MGCNVNFMVIDGHLIDPQEISVVTKLAPVCGPPGGEYYTIFLRGGGSLVIYDVETRGPLVHFLTEDIRFVAG